MENIILYWSLYIVIAFVFNVDSIMKSFSEAFLPVSFEKVEKPGGRVAAY